jgi:CTP synthase
MIIECGRQNAISVHLTLIPEVAGSELKTKPTQHSVKAMQEIGIQPDILICRAPHMLDDATRRKIALFTNLDMEHVFTGIDIKTTIYEVPLVYHSQKLDEVILNRMGVESRHADLKNWKKMMERFHARKGKVRIGIVGKYMELNDSYKSVYEALFHAGLANEVEVELVKIDSQKLEDIPDNKTIEAMLGTSGFNVDGILVPGGFGSRGIIGMVRAANWARTRKKPYFGICLGMQIMLIEWGRGVLGWDDADSTEFHRTTEHAVVSLLVEQEGITNYGGTMRLGRMETVAAEGSLLFAAYGKRSIWERHRHRYEFSNKYRAEMAKSGLKLTGTTVEGALVECVEWPDNAWGLGVQFHPEFKSKPTEAHPLFRDFIAAVKANVEIKN